jgi:hypothetical protein
MSNKLWTSLFNLVITMGMEVLLVIVRMWELLVNAHLC